METKVTKAYHGVYSSSKEILKNNQRHLFCNMLDLLTNTCKTFTLVGNKITSDEMFNFWLMDVLPLTFDKDLAIQTKAVEAFEQGLISLDLKALHSSPQWLVWKHTLVNSYSGKVKALREDRNSLWYRVWCFIIQLLDRELLKGANCINTFLSIVELGFRSADNTVRVEAFHCWRLLIEIFNKHNELTAMKRLKLLCIPLKSSQSKSVEGAEIKLRVWWYLLTALGDNIREHFEMVVQPFLLFCFGTQNSTTGKPALGAVQQYEVMKELAVPCLTKLLSNHEDDNLERVMRDLKLEDLNTPSPLLGGTVLEQHSLLLANTAMTALHLSQTNEDDFGHKHIYQQLLKQLMLITVRQDKAELFLCVCSQLIEMTADHHSHFVVQALNILATEGVTIKKLSQEPVGFGKFLKAFAQLFAKARSLVPPAILNACIKHVFQLNVKQNWTHFQILADSVFFSELEQEDYEAFESKLLIWLQTTETLVQHLRENTLELRVKEKADLTERWLLWPLQLCVGFAKHRSNQHCFDNDFCASWRQLLSLGQNSPNRDQFLTHVHQHMEELVRARLELDAFGEIFDAYAQAVLKLESHNLNTSSNKKKYHGFFSLLQLVLTQRPALPANLIKACLNTLRHNFVLNLKHNEISETGEELKSIVALMMKLNSDPNNKLLDNGFIDEWKRVVLEKLRLHPNKELMAQLRDLFKGNDNVFVVIPSVWSLNPDKLTERQKERLSEKQTIPALYNDMSQSQENSLQPWTPKKIVMPQPDNCEILMENGANETGGEKIILPGQGESCKEKEKPKENADKLRKIDTNEKNESKVKVSERRVERPNTRQSRKASKENRGGEKLSEQQNNASSDGVAKRGCGLSLLAKKSNRETKNQLKGTDKNKDVQRTNALIEEKASTSSTNLPASEDLFDCLVEEQDRTDSLLPLEPQQQQENDQTNDKNTTTTTMTVASEEKKSKEISPQSSPKQHHHQDENSKINNTTNVSNSAKTNKNNECVPLQATVPLTTTNPNKNLLITSVEVVSAKNTISTTTSTKSKKLIENDEQLQQIASKTKAEEILGKIHELSPNRRQIMKTTTTTHYNYEPIKAIRDKTNIISNIDEIVGIMKKSKPTTTTTRMDNIDPLKDISAKMEDDEVVVESYEISPNKRKVTTTTTTPITTITATTEQPNEGSPKKRRTSMSPNKATTTTTTTITTRSQNIKEIAQMKEISPKIITTTINMNKENVVVTASPAIEPTTVTAENKEKAKILTKEATTTKSQQQNTVVDVLAMKKLSSQSTTTTTTTTTSHTDEEEVSQKNELSPNKTTTTTTINKEIEGFKQAKEISPIKTTTTTTAISKLLFSPPERKIICTNTSPILKSKPTTTHLTGRGAQLINMIRNRKSETPTTTRLCDSVITINATSTPLQRTRANLMECGSGTEQETSTVVESKDLLEFCKRLPPPTASPSVSILKRKLGHDSSIEESLVSGIDTPVSKRKKVSFHDPPVSITKEYIKDREEVRSKSKRCLVMDKSSPPEGKYTLRRRSKLDNLVEIEKISSAAGGCNIFNEDNNENDPDSGTSKIAKESMATIKWKDNRNALENNQNKEQQQQQQQSVHNDEQVENVFNTSLDILTANAAPSCSSPIHHHTTKKMDLQAALKLITEKCSLETVLEQYIARENLPQLQFTHQLSKFMANMMDLHPKIKTTVMETLSERHSKDFLDHAIQENLSTVVCDRLNLDAIISYVCAKSKINHGCRNTLFQHMPDIVKQCKLENERTKLLKSLLNECQLTDEQTLDLIGVLMAMREDKRMTNCSAASNDIIVVDHLISESAADSSSSL